MDDEKKIETPEKKENVETVKDSHPVMRKEPQANKDTTITDKIRENPWVLATVVLAIVTIILLIGNFGGNMTGAAVGVASQEDVESKVLEFVQSQVEGDVEIVDTVMDSGLYMITISLDGREIPLYVTADGKNLVQGVTSLDLLMNPETDDTSGDTPAPTEVPKSDKPEVELFVMSMCPYGTQAEKGILSAVGLLGDKIDFKLRFVSYAMHGKTEVDENTVEYCVQKEEPAKLYEYLICYLDNQDPATWKACRDRVGLNKAKIDSCIAAADKEFKITELFNDKSTWSGGTYPQYNVDKVLNDEYGVRGSPTLVINGVQSNAGRSSASYLAGICAAFNDAPEECSEVLDSASPAPGFGWDATAAANTAAQCG